MSIFTRDKFLSLDEERDHEAGIGIGDLGRALVTWVGMNFQVGGRISVAQAATAFNTTDAAIRDAINAAAWISYVGEDGDPEQQFIELDGE
jgi:hypothetical protein